MLKCLSKQSSVSGECFYCKVQSAITIILKDVLFLLVISFNILIKTSHSLIRRWRRYILCVVSTNTVLSVGVGEGLGSRGPLLILVDGDSGGELSRWKNFT